jgi:8-oxo-dGTP diphosphatase
MDHADSFRNQDIKVTVDAIVFGYNQENGISVLPVLNPLVCQKTAIGHFSLLHHCLLAY